MAEKLVYIGQVKQVIPIQDADKIESLEVVCGEGGVCGNCFGVDGTTEVTPNGTCANWKKKIQVVATVLMLKGKASDVFKQIAQLAKDEPKKTIKQIWLDNKKN